MPDQLAIRDADLAAHAAALARLEREVMAERSAVARLTAASAAQKAELDAHKVELDAMRRSTSWRMTRSLRFVADAARLIAGSLRR